MMIFMTHQHLTILTGASRGMGLAMAEQLLQPDCTLLCISRHENPSLATLAQAKGATLKLGCSHKTLPILPARL